MGRDNTVVSLFAGRVPEPDDVQRASEAVRSWARQDGLTVVDDPNAPEQVILLQIGDEPWITPLRTGLEIDEDTARAWACGLSKHSGMPAVGGVVHDSDLLELFLARDGEVAGELNMSDIYFDGEAAEEPTDGELIPWEVVLRDPGKMVAFEKRWRRREKKPESALAELCKLLGFDGGGMGGFAAARWMLTEDTLQAAGGFSLPTRVLARIGIQD